MPRHNYVLIQFSNAESLENREYDNIEFTAFIDDLREVGNYCDESDMERTLIVEVKEEYIYTFPPSAVKEWRIDND